MAAARHDEALICFALIVTIPFGVAPLRLASYSLWPFAAIAWKVNRSRQYA